MLKTFASPREAMPTLQKGGRDLINTGISKKLKQLEIDRNFAIAFRR